MPPSLSSQRSSVWTEGALVIGILALVTLAVYLSVDTIRKQADITQAINDVTAIQTAVIQWAKEHAEEPNEIPTVWSQVAKFMPEELQEAAHGSDDAYLRGNTPWESDYVLSVSSVTGATPSVAITGVPEDMREAVASQMQKIGATGVGPCVLPTAGDICIELLP